MVHVDTVIVYAYETLGIDRTAANYFVITITTSLDVNTHEFE